MPLSDNVIGEDETKICCTLSVPVMVHPSFSHSIADGSDSVKSSLHPTIKNKIIPIEMIFIIPPIVVNPD